jgi:hypothetical protein
MAGRNGNSEYFEVKGRGKQPYQVTINYDTGHFCTCRGMLSMKKTYQEDAGRTHGTSCKHIKSTIKDKFNNDWGKKVTGGGGRRTQTSSAPVSTPPTTPAQPTGRRAAIMAQRAKRERETTGRRAAHAAQKANRTNSDLPLLDRIAALEAAREGATS